MLIQRLVPTGLASEWVMISILGLQNSLQSFIDFKVFCFHSTLLNIKEIITQVFK